MRNLISAKAVFTSVFTCTLCISLAGFSQKKSNEALPSGSVKLEYSYPSDRSVKYLNNTKVIQDMNVDGQSMLVNVTSYLLCNVRSAGKQTENLTLEIKIDTMAQNIDTPQGDSGGPVNEVKDKVFNITITSSGLVKDISEAAKIVFSGSGGAQSDMSESFMNYFPVLPVVAVKKGDTWITYDTVQTKSQSNTRWMPVESNNKFEGIEKYNGIDCAKITAALSGTMKMTTQSQGMDISTNGIYTGTMVLLFALKEGYFISQTATTRMKGTIEITNQSMLFPVVMDITSTNEMVR